MNGHRSTIKIDEIDAPKIRIFVERRQAENQSAASINRELNIIAATLHQAAEFFPELGQWQAPKIPRPKASKRRRERIITDEEYLSASSFAEASTTTCFEVSARAISARSPDQPVA